MPTQNYKFGVLPSENETDATEFFYANHWKIEQTSGAQRLMIAPKSDQIDLIIELSRELPEPFGILYVLVVPRGGNLSGRYQSFEPAGRRAMENFLRRFRDFFERDARHHLWIASLPVHTTLVYDNHNVIYAYGEPERLKKVLLSKGLTEGEVIVPAPHVHHYNPDYDAEESSVLSGARWKHFPLTESDY